MSESNESVEKFEDAKERFNDAMRIASMDRITREVADLDTSVEKMPSEIEEVRDRGYAFRSYLERKAEVFAKNWEDIKRRVTSAVDTEVEELRQDVDEAEKQVQQAERYAELPAKLERIIAQVEGAVERLENRVEGAAERIQAMYETLKRDVDSTYSQLRQVKWFMDMKDEASFEFMQGESVFLVAEAEWVATGKGKEDPDGMLFLTDQRLVFEQKEKTGKRFGMFGGKMTQEVELDIPLHHVENVEAENKGMFGGKDMLHFTMKDGPHSKITIEVKGSADNKFWVKQINRMAAGEADDERAIEPDAEMVERLREAPTECHVCGATLPILMAGQTQIACVYFGAVIRL